MLEIEKNYILCKRVYQSLFFDITDLFIQYIHSLLTKSNDLMTIEKQTDEGQNQLSKYKILLNFYIFFNFFTILMVVCR